MKGTLLRCEGVVLRYVNYGEADRIVSVLTASWGIKKGFARSARNSRKRFGPALEPFTQALFHWRQGRGELWTLQEADLITPRSGLRTDLDRLALAGYGVELVELLAADAEDHQRIYELLCSYLDYLEGGGDPAVARLLFELRLVYLLGYIPHLLHCSDCLKIFDNESVRFDFRRGGSLCLECASAVSAHWRDLYAFHINSLKVLSSAIQPYVKRACCCLRCSVRFCHVNRTH